MKNLTTRRSGGSCVLLLALLVSCADEDGSTSAPPGSVGNAGQSGAAGQGGAAGKSAGGASGSGGAQGGAAGKAGAGGAAGQGGKGGSAGGKIACTMTNDCVGFIPETKPAGCAKATCDATQKFCRFIAKDLDGDGDPSNSCASQDGKIVIELGGDCDEGDSKVNSKEWDGPAGLYKGVQQPDRCDGIADNDCNGPKDDGKLDDGTTCKCKPGDVRKCSEDSAGKAVVFPGGKPQGECKYGSQTCEASGNWGPCTGAVGPAKEECNGGKDDDCDGKADDLDDDVSNAGLWFCDGDNDDFAAPGSTPEKSCEVPAKICAGPTPSWKLDLPASDCNDLRYDTHPNAADVCDNVDNDCDDQIDEDAKSVKRDCGSVLDNNCDGIPDNTPDAFCQCAVGTSVSCGSGTGACIPGKQDCLLNIDGSSNWSACNGANPPQQESCQPEKDLDCNGAVGDTPGCQKTVWVLHHPSEGNPPCIDPGTQVVDALASGAQNESGYQYYAWLNVWAEHNGHPAAAVRRCSRSGPYFTMAVGGNCPAGFDTDGVMGYVSYEENPGIFTKVYSFNTAAGGEPVTGYCSGLGCAKIGCSGYVLVPTPFYAWPG